jgi:hypothetical protein
MPEMRTEISWAALPAIPADLLVAKEQLYDTCGLACTLPRAEAESAGYGAYTFTINSQSIRFRVAKTTPTKPGQFVTLWKRVGRGPIQPFDMADEVDLFIISTRQGSHCGQFIFPSSVLLQRGILSGNNKEGKRAMRVYSPWDIATNQQAQKTQQWQLEYFLEIPNDKPVDLTRAKKLFQHFS